MAVEMTLIGSVCSTVIVVCGHPPVGGSGFNPAPLHVAC